MSYGITYVMADIPSEKKSDVTNDQASNVKIDVTRGTTCDVI